MNSKELLQYARESKEPPPEPPEGIPPQKLPSWIRILLHCIVLPFLYLDLGVEKLAKKIVRPPYLRQGSCKRRGNCCYFLLFPHLKGLMRKLFFFWAKEFHGFYERPGLEIEHNGKKFHVMGCRYLTKDGQCSNYRLRPKICRTWPLIEIFGRPRVLKGCGYTAVLRKSYSKKHPSLRILEEDPPKDSET